MPSWQWWHPMRVVNCWLFRPLWRPGMGDLSQFFFANLTNCLYRDGEFRCCHRLFGVIRSQIHVFWRPMGKKSRISENEVKNGCHPLFRKFVNLWRQSWISENDDDETHFTLTSGNSRTSIGRNPASVAAAGSRIPKDEDETGFHPHFRKFVKTSKTDLKSVFWCHFLFLFSLEFIGESFQKLDLVSFGHQ